MELEGGPTERPYRSHLQPACIPCRKRKSRCKVDGQSPRCLMCRFHGSECRFPEPSEQPASPDQQPERKKQRRSARVPAGIRVNELSGSPGKAPQATQARPQHGSTGRKSPEETPFSSSAGPFAEVEDELHIIGPVLNPDAQPIADYLANDSTTDVRAARLIRAFPEHVMTGRTPIMFSTIRRRPLGTVANQTAASLKCQMVEKLVDPGCPDLINLYFEKVQNCLPILDEVTFRAQYASAKEQISSALLASLYAQAMVFWKQSLRKTGRHCPDIRFVWNQACDALYSELHLSPGISTAVAILLNISGRPLTLMIGNGVLLGSAISLAHSLGLNRDPFTWEISTAEKRLRTRIWWVIVVFDKWSSVAYGTPPHLRRDQYDVPLPSFTGNASSGDHSAHSALSHVFIGLVTLTEVLDDYIEHVFYLKRTIAGQESPKRPDMESKVISWEDSLPGELRRAVLRGVDLSIPGSPNLRLAYLYIKLLGQKLRQDSQKDSHVDSNSQKRLHLPVRRAAEEVVLFIQELDERALSDFWLPSSAFALSSTVASLLRCALESERGADGLASSISLKLAQNMISALQEHRRRYGWDIGNICLQQYVEVVEKLGASNDGSWEAVPDLGQFLSFTLPDVNEPFQSLWDWFETA